MEAVQDIQQEEVHWWKKIWKAGRWFLAGFLLVTFFTLLKLPTEKIQQLILAEMTNSMRAQNMDLRVQSGSLSWIFGPRLILQDVQIFFPASRTSIKMDRLAVSPSVIGMLFGRLSASISLWRGRGGADIDWSSSSSSYSGSIDFDDLNLSDTNLLGAPTGILLKGLISGRGSVSGEPKSLATTQGELRVKFTDLKIPEQELQSADMPFLKGFRLPELIVGSGEISAQGDSGKWVISKLELGADAKGSDLVLRASGDITLARFFESSQLNIKGSLKLSERASKSLALLEALLGSGKRPDGSFGFTLTGMAGQPNFAPGP